MERTPSRILILGAGFAGIATARGLERGLRPDEAQITVVGRDNFSLFTPMLPEVSAGGLETRHIVTPVRAQLKRSQFILGDVTAIDLDAKAIDVSQTLTGRTQTLPYDQLVFALGSVTSTFGIPGIGDHALPLKSLEDAERLRNRVIASLEQADVTTDPAARARLLTFVIVGGGYTGVEGAGELVDLFKSITPYYETIKAGDVRIVLIEAGKTLLAGLPAGMGVYTTKNLMSRGIEISLGDGVTKLDDRAIHLASGKTIETATVLWSAGVRPTSVLKDLPVQHARNGGIVVGRDMAVPDRPRCLGARRLRVDPDRQVRRLVSDDGAACDSRRSGGCAKHHCRNAWQCDEAVRLHRTRHHGVARLRQRRRRVTERLRPHRLHRVVHVAYVLSLAIAGSRSQGARCAGLATRADFPARYRRDARVHRKVGAKRGPRCGDGSAGRDAGKDHDRRLTGFACAW